MPRPEQLAELAREVASLSAPDRRAVLRTLTRPERRLLSRAERSPRVAVALPEDRHSAWFKALLVAARGGNGPMTALAREALSATMPKPAEGERHAKTRSLFDVASGVLSRPRPRP